MTSKERGPVPCSVVPTVPDACEPHGGGCLAPGRSVLLASSGGVVLGVRPSDVLATLCCTLQSGCTLSLGPSPPPCPNLCGYVGVCVAMLLGPGVRVLSQVRVALPQHRALLRCPAVSRVLPSACRGPGRLPSTGGGPASLWQPVTWRNPGFCFLLFLCSCACACTCRGAWSFGSRHTLWSEKHKP